jgi:hypothetical protein
MAESDYVQLTGNFYFDPVNRIILKKLGGSYTVVLHDRRRLNKSVAVDRRKKEEMHPTDLKPLGKGLYWDPKSKDLFRKAGDKWVLFTKDRRKQPRE